MDDAELLESVLSDTAMSATVFSASPDAAVAHCPGWTVADLVSHHGGVLRWAEAIVRTGEPVVEQSSAPARHDERHTWYLDAANEFVATVSGSDRDRACWTFGRPPERVWFWVRRQALEAAVHRWDAELAAGSASKIHSDLSILGVTEVVEDLFPRQVALARTPALSCGVELRADDVDQRWVRVVPQLLEPDHSLVEQWRRLWHQIARVTNTTNITTPPTTDNTPTHFPSMLSER